MWNVDYQRYHITCCYQDSLPVVSRKEEAASGAPTDSRPAHTREYFTDRNNNIKSCENRKYHN